MMVSEITRKISSIIVLLLQRWWSQMKSLPRVARVVGARKAQNFRWRLSVVLENLGFWESSHTNLLVGKILFSVPKNRRPTFWHVAYCLRNSILQNFLVFALLENFGIRERAITRLFEFPFSIILRYK